MTSSFWTVLPDSSSWIEPIRCLRWSRVVTVVVATPALLHLPALIHSIPTCALHPSFLVSVYRAYPYMACSFQRAAVARKKHERLLSTAPHRSVSAARFKHGSSRLEAHESENTLPGQAFRNLAIKNPMVSLSALWVRGAAVLPWSQLSSGRNLWSICSCSGDSPAPCRPSAPTWGSWGKRRMWWSDDTRTSLCQWLLLSPEAEVKGRETCEGPRRPVLRSQPESPYRCCRQGRHPSSATALPEIQLCVTWMHNIY